MRRVWKTFCSYVWWTHRRGGFHYDVMVTLILLFVFLMPRSIFHDKPTVRNPHQTEVVVRPEGDHFIYEIDASAVQPGNRDEIKDELRKIIEPIAGEIEVVDAKPVRDAKGHIKSYQAWVTR
jgi:hypothetical protein